MGRGSSDLLQLLANPTNRAILSVLAIEPQYPRRLADVVGLTEDEASRRLRQFEKLGLAEADWANVGKTVRLYRLASARLTVEVTPGGLTVSGLPEEGPVRVGAVGETPPVLHRFVGRDSELRALLDLLETRRAVCLHGIGGAGKTTLAAAVAARWGMPVVWHTLAPSESGNLLLARVASGTEGVASRDLARRLFALRSGEEGALLLDAIAAAANEAGALLVLDRFEAGGEGSGDVATALARKVTRGRLLLTARQFPRDVARDAVGPFRLEGLSRADAAALLRAFRPALDDATVDDLYARTQGHALALVLLGLGDPAQPVRGADVSRDEGIRDFLTTDVLPQLPESEREILLALSVLRGPFTAEEAEAASGSRHARDALLRLEARGLVTRAGDVFALHDLVRVYAYDAVPERKKVHARAAKALRETGESAKVLEALHHHHEAGQLTEAARIVRDECVRQAYRFSDQGLMTLYRDELEHLEATRALAPEDAAAVSIELAHFHAKSGGIEPVRRRLETVHATLGGRMGELAGPMLLARARLHQLEGHREEASRLYREAVETARRSGDASATLRCLVDHAFSLEEWTPGAALVAYEEAIRFGAEASDVRYLSLAYGGAARLGMELGDPRGKVWAEEALRLARVAGYRRGEAAVHVALALHQMMTAQPEEGWEHIERYREIAELLGDPWLKACMLDEIAFFHVATAQHERAIETAKEARAYARSLGSAFYALAASVAEGEALVALGRPHAAVDAVSPLLAAAGDASAIMRARAHRVLADAFAALGEAERASQERERVAAIERSFRGEAAPNALRPGWMVHPPGGYMP